MYEKLEPITHYGVVDRLPVDDGLKYVLNEMLGEFHDLNEILVNYDLSNYGYNAIDRVEKLIEHYHHIILYRGT